MLLRHFNDKEQLFFLLSKGTTVLTPNNRLSESILQQYFTYHKNLTIDKPKCMPYRIALIKAYGELNFTKPHIALNSVVESDVTHPTLLSETQCQHLWRKIVKSTSHITYSEGLLKAIINAWKRCLQWGIHPEDQAFHYTTQTRQFQKWWQLFNDQLEQLYLITEYQLTPYLLEANSSLFSQSVVWVCFDDFTPQQVQLQEHLDKKGLAQYQYDLKEKLSKIEVLTAQDNTEEHHQLMAWLHLKVHGDNQRVGIVVPNLEQESLSLQRSLAQHFDSTLFNISLGQSLYDFPLVAHALCWLKLDERYINSHQASLLLHSPYLGGSNKEFLARSECLQESTLLKKRIILLNTFIEELSHHAPQLAKLLGNITSYPQTATVHQWIHLFQERLNTLGFPGEYGLNSENYQCFNRFIALFDELRQLALLDSNLTKDEALETLQYLAESTIFQAQKINAPIQISGLLEASGCEFDSLWVMGLTDQCLPQKVHLSAFIPPQLQRELHMPHSLPARELQFAQKIIQRLQNSADSIVFSSAQLQGDSPNLPCSLITKFPNFERLTIHDALKQDSDLITIKECFEIPLLPEEPIPGGTAILANQAKCPFKAFAEHRLRVKAPLQTLDGIDNKERGQIIHKVMELLWHTLGNQQQLIHLTPNILEQQIDSAIRAALTPLKQQATDSSLNLNSAVASTTDGYDSTAEFRLKSIQEVEYTRIKRLVTAYLEWEKQRPPFAIAALEQSYSINLAGLEFQVRIDRLDQVADKKWVIDYKSSLPASKPWNEDRPKEPQLLLYALLDDQINTLLLLQLKTGKISCFGFSEEKHDISGITSLKKEATWAQYRDTWQQQLSDLAIEFQQGHCPPQPAHLTICQQCDFQNLCRFQADE